MVSRFRKPLEQSRPCIKVVASSQKPILQPRSVPRILHRERLQNRLLAGFLTVSGRSPD